MSDEQPTERFTAPLAPASKVRAKRPFPVWPAVVIVLAVALVAVSVAMILMLTTGTREPEEVPPTDAPATSIPPTTTPAPPPTAEPAPPPPPRPEPGRNQCVDGLRDTSGVDLDNVTLEYSGRDLVARFVLATELPAGESGLGIVLERSNASQSHQLAVRFIDGRLDRYVSWQGDDQDSLDRDDVSVQGNTIVLTLPGDAERQLRGDWRWSAFGTAPGTELDTCPGPGETLKFDRRD